MAEQAPKEPKQDAEAPATVPAPASSLPPAHRPPSNGRTSGMGSLLLTVLLTLIVALGITTLVLWLIYRPHKPRVYVDGLSISDLNVTDGYVTSNMQFTLLIQNTNRRLSIRYDRLVASVTYRGQLITTPTRLPNLCQGHRSLFAVNAYMAPNSVPVYPEVGGGLVADEGYGLVELRLEIRGRYRWRSALWKSARHHVYVTCDLLVRIDGQVALLRGHRCDVDV